MGGARVAAVRERAGSADSLKSLERAGWSERAESYGLLTGRITARLAEPLLDAAGVAAGSQVLDVGTGPGYAASRAADRGAVATGVDIADEMVALARRRHGAISFRRADAEELPFRDRSFDALVGNLVINHLPRPERAVHEFARVLARSGGMALSTWDVPENSRFLGILLDALRACGLADGGEAATGPDPFRFAGDDEFRRLLRGADLEEVEVRKVSLVHRVVDADELWRGLLGGSVRTAGLVMRQPPHIRNRIRGTVERLAEEYRVDHGLAIPAAAKIARARKP